MRIGTKLVVFLAAPLLVLMALFGYLNQRRSSQLLQEELVREGRATARTVQFEMEDAVADGQLENTRELVDQITGYERVLGLRIFSQDGRLYYQSSNLQAHPFEHPDALARVLSDRKPVETHLRVGEHPVVSLIFPLARPGGDLFGAVELLQIESFVEEDARASRRDIAALTAAMIVATAVVILVVTRVNVTRPIEELAQSFRRAGAGDLAARAPVRREDELGRLAMEFNRMTERLEETQRRLAAEQDERRRVEARLRNAERLASLGRLAAGLAHEIGTPLNVIGGRADTLLRKLAGHDVAEKNLRIISTQIDRITRIVRGMLDFARVPEPRLAPVEVSGVVRKIVDLLENRFEQAGVQVELTLPEDLPQVPADAGQIEQVFLNLATNAIDAMPRGGTLRIAARRVERHHPVNDAAGRAYLAVAFEDTGPGIAAQNIDRIFDPFFTTKDVGKGTGLGLSIAYGIAQEHGGWMDVESPPERGACLTVYLPIEPAAARGAPDAGRRAS